METQSITRHPSNTVASYATAANRAGARVTVTTEHVITKTDNGRFVDQVDELHIRQRCHGCGDNDGIRAPFDEGDRATRQMKQQALAHADSCRL